MLSIVTVNEDNSIKRGYYDGNKFVKHSLIGQNIIPAYELIERGKGAGGASNIKEYYFHGKKTSFTDIEGNKIPAVEEYIDGELLRISYYDDDLLQSFVDKNGRIMPAVIESGVSPQDIGLIHRENYYDKGSLNSFVDELGNMLPSTIDYYFDGKIEDLQFHIDGELHSFKNKYGMLMPAIISYDDNGDVSYTEYYNHGSEMAEMFFNGDNIVSCRRY